MQRKAGETVPQDREKAMAESTKEWTCPGVPQSPRFVAPSRKMAEDYANSKWGNDDWTPEVNRTGGTPPPPKAKGAK